MERFRGMENREENGMSDIEIVRTEEVIAAEIRVIKEQTRVAVLSGAIEIGRRLAEAKAIVPHGQWGAWLEENVDYSERTAQNLMRVFEEYGKKPNPPAFADLSYSKALALLGLPWEERSELIESGAAESMTTRELEAEVKRMREEIDRRQMRIEELLEVEAEKDALRVELEGVREDIQIAKEREEKIKKSEEAFRRDVDSLRKSNMELEAELEKERAKPPETRIETVEMLPAAVEEELTRLREIAAHAPNAAIVRLRAGYERLLQEFQAVTALLNEVQRDAPEDYAQYRAALRLAAERMAQALGETQ